MNIAEKKKNLKSLLKNLPALRNPTISNLSLKGWWRWRRSLTSTCGAKLIPQLKSRRRGRHHRNIFAETRWFLIELRDKMG